MSADDVIDPVIREKGDETMPRTVNTVTAGFQDFRLYAFKGIDIFVHSGPQKTDVLCKHGREECESDTRICSKPVEDGQGSRPVEHL